MKRIVIDFFIINDYFRKFNWYYQPYKYFAVDYNENERLFCGYTSQPWRSGHGSFDFYSEDDQAFIFSFNKNQKLKVRPDKKH